MPDITIQTVARDPWEFRVTLTEDEEIVGEHTVKMTDEEYEEYGDDVEPQELVQATFAFLLSREDPEMILDQFHLRDVEKYFPEYPDRVADYL